MKKNFRYISLRFVTISLCLCASVGLMSLYATLTLSKNAAAGTDLIIDKDESLELPDPPAEETLYDFGTDLIINAINPGYTIDGTSNVGEFIELQNLSDVPIALAGYSLRYTNGSGNTTTLYTFLDGSYMTGKHLLLSYYKPGMPADDTYRGNGLAMKAGPLELVYEDEVIDSVCWNNATGCETEFKKDGKDTYRSTLVRNLATGEFAHLKMDDYSPHYVADFPSLYLEPEDELDDPSEENKIPQCRGLEFSELLTYYADDKSEQFIELFNSTSTEINLTGCEISYKNKTYPLSGTVLSGAYYVFHQSELFSLTKNPKNPLTLAIIDTDGTPVDEIAYPNGQKKSTSYARTFDESGNESWQITYAITPGAENIYQKYRTCEEGKIINEATGNCVKVTSIKDAASAALKNSILAPCPEGKYRNPLTNRCKNIETSSSTLKECAEGYERNPETNRCRKIKTANDGAEYAIVPNTRSDKTVFIGAGIIAIIVLLGVIYVTLQFRQEIARATRKARQRVHDILEHSFSARIRRHRDKKP